MWAGFLLQISLSNSFCAFKKTLAHFGYSQDSKKQSKQNFYTFMDPGDFYTISGLDFVKKRTQREYRDIF